jgi:uncharacterized protein (TIGR01244 family)
MRDMKNWKYSIPLAAILALPLMPQLACSRPLQDDGQTAQEEAPSSTASRLLPNGRQPVPGLLTGGQPSDDQLEKLAQLGYKTVVSLRTEGEAGSQGEAELAGRLGLRFVSIPIAGTAGLTRENAQRLADVLGQAEGSTVIHCASGNRVGALLALKDYWIDGASAEDSLQLGLKAGLTRLEPAVKERLGLRQ